MALKFMFYDYDVLTVHGTKYCEFVCSCLRDMNFYVDTHQNIFGDVILTISWEKCIEQE